LKICFIYLVVHSAQKKQLKESLSSFPKIRRVQSKISIHVLSYQNIPSSLKNRNKIGLAKVTYFQSSNGLQPHQWLKKHLKSKCKLYDYYILLEPHYRLRPYRWKRLFRKLKLEKPTDFLIAGQANKKKLPLPRYNRLFHQPNVLIVPAAKINHLPFHKGSEPTKGAILPYHGFLLHLLLQKKIKWIRQSLFRQRQINRNEGEWSVWKQILRQELIQHYPDKVPMYNNRSKFIQSLKQSSTLEKPSGKDRITVLMSVYNEGPYIVDCLKSLALQTDRNFQCVIVDDASIDGSLKMIKKWQAHIPNCTIIEQEQNRGKGRSMNKGLKYIETPFVLELDGDDWLDPDAIKILNEKVKKMKESDIYAYGDRRKFRVLRRENLLVYRGIYSGVKWRGTEAFIAEKRPYGPRIYRTVALKEVGGWPTAEDDGNDGRLFEDFLLVLKLITKGNFQYWPHDPVYNIRIHKDSQSVSHLDQIHSILDPHISRAMKKGLC
jgi:hypothetical protein